MADPAEEVAPAVAAQRKRRKQAAKAGLCLWCTEPTHDGHSLCPTHEKQVKDNYRTRKAAGLCVRCSEPADEGSARCGPCKVVHRERARKARAEKKAAAKKAARKRGRS